MKRAFIGLVIGIMLPILGEAGVADDMQNFFNQSGYASNVTNADVWKNQAAGYVGGGSLYARNAVRTYQLIRLDLPSFRAGCGGIDMYTGAFSFISADKLVEMGKQIMTNGGAYAVDLMLATTVPELLERKNYLQDLATKINTTNINSCNASKALIGGIWPKTTESQIKICRDLKTSGASGLSADYAKAKQDCENIDEFNKTMKDAQKDKDYKSQVLMNKNLIWDAIQAQPLLSNDRELANFIMNLTGTIIFDSKGNPTIVPSIADSHQLIKAFIGDGEGDVTIQIQKCEEHDDKCLSIQSSSIQITKDKSLSARIETLITSISDKLRANSENGAESDWTDEEKRFVSMSSIPVMKAVTVMGQLKYGLTSSDLMEYSSLIAQDIFQQYLGELLSGVKASITNAQIQEDLLKDIERRVHQAQVTISKLDPKISRKIQEKLAFIQKIQLMERQVASEMANGLK
jgi:conjugative transfer pilus assembly protein TraH